ncbi:MAG: O-antigen ligase family protein [Candidatus Levybacteria bacterium]|nr:O-antigen ligase family protein [Candidatus Levybacteria bacterium]
MREGKESWSLGQSKLSLFFFYLLILFLPTQLGKHFFLQSSFIAGLRIDYLSYTLYLTDILIILIFLSSFKNVFKTVLTKYKNKFFRFFLFALFLTIGISVSKNPQVGIYGLVKLFEFSYLGIFIYLNYREINKKILVALISFGIVFQTLLSALQYLNNGSLQGIFYFLGERSFNSQTPSIANVSVNAKLILRPYATFPHPNVLAGFIALSSMLLVYFKNRINKHLLLIVLTISTTGIIISFSRVGLLVWTGFIFSYFLTTLLKKYKKIKLNTRFIKNNSLPIIVGSGFLLSLFFLFLTNPLFIQRLSSFSFSDESVVQRLNTISASINMFMQNPVFGVGINNFLNNLNTSFNSPALLQPVHNVFLLVLSQTGIVGLLAFGYLFFKAIRVALGFGKEKIIRILIVLAIIFIGMFDHYLLTIQQTQILFTMLIAIALIRQKNLLE